MAPAPPAWRRLFHIGAGSTIPILGIFVSSGVMVFLLATLSGLALVVELARFKLPSLNSLLVRELRPLLKQTEDRRLTGATYIAVSALVAFLIFDKPIAVTALLFLSLGDPIAAVVGNRMGGFRVFGKSPWGTVAFAAASLAMSAVLAVADVASPYWLLAAGAAVAAVVELVPFPVDDNVTIPLISGAAMTLMAV